jgi:hypothetical protein
MAEGKPVPDALREAKLAAIRRGAPARDWAAFTVVGDPSVRVPLERPRAPRGGGRWALLAAAGGVIAMAGGYHVWRRGREARRGGA